MKPTDLIDQDGENALQEIAEQLEQIAEEIRGRGMRGRRVGDVAYAGPALFALTQRMELLTFCEAPDAPPPLPAERPDDPTAPALRLVRTDSPFRGAKHR